LQTARDRFRQAVDAESTWRKKAVEDVRFRAGEQWHADQMKSRLSGPTPRPCLTINQLPRFIRQITNAERQNRPGIKVRPVDSLSDPETAKIAQGLTRHIEYDSDADVAYDTAFDTAVTHGKGFWRVLTCYEDPWSFQQVVKIERILNPFCVYLDPAGRRDPDYHRMAWGFVVDRVSKDEVCARYGIANATWQAWQSLGDTHWVLKDECLVADYYYKDEYPIVLVQLATGQTRYLPKPQSLPPSPSGDDAGAGDPFPPDAPDPVAPGWTPGQALRAQAELAQIVQVRMQQHGVLPLSPEELPLVVGERPSSVPIIRCCKLNGYTVLERSLWAGQYIPIVPVIGDEIDIEGEVDYRGIVRDAIDAQRMYNYWTTVEAETIALGPKVPYIGAEGQFKNHEREWATANVTPYGFLQYNPVAIQGTLVPPPQRQAIEPPIQALSVAKQQAGQDLYTTIGITPADLGEPSNEKSGRAITARKRESELGTSHFLANLFRAIRHTGRIILDLVPHIYSEPGRIVRILGEDQSQQAVMLHPAAQGNGRLPDGQDLQLPPGIAGVYNLSVGRYDVVIETGPSYATQREEAADTLVQLAQAVPQIAQVAPDLLAALQDFDGAEELARRLKKTVPPELLDEPGAQAKPEDMVVRLQAQLTQMGQQLQQLNAFGQQAEQQLEQLAQEKQQLTQDQSLKVAEIQLKEREIALKEREVALKAQAEAAHAALERDKLALEARAQQHGHEETRRTRTVEHVGQLRAHLEAMEAMLARQGASDDGQ
jgi:hypothetical protein